MYYIQLLYSRSTYKSRKIYARTYERLDRTYCSCSVLLYPYFFSIFCEFFSLSAFLKEGKKVSQPVQSVEVDSMIEDYIKGILYYFENPSIVSDDLIRLKVKELILLLVNSSSSATAVLAGR